MKRLDIAISAQDKEGEMVLSTRIDDVRLVYSPASDRSSAVDGYYLRSVEGDFWGGGLHCFFSKDSVVCVLRYDGYNVLHVMLKGV